MAAVRFSPRDDVLTSDPRKVSDIHQEPVRLQHPPLTHLVLLYISSVQNYIVLHLLNTFMHLWLHDRPIC